MIFSACEQVLVIMSGMITFQEDTAFVSRACNWLESSYKGRQTYSLAASGAQGALLIWDALFVLIDASRQSKLYQEQGYGHNYTTSVTAGLHAFPSSQIHL